MDVSSSYFTQNQNTRQERTVRGLECPWGYVGGIKFIVVEASGDAEDNFENLAVAMKRVPDVLLYRSKTTQARIDYDDPHHTKSVPHASNRSTWKPTRFRLKPHLILSSRLLHAQEYLSTSLTKL